MPKMIKLKTTDNQKVGIAVGCEYDGCWYVQTTDLHEGTLLSEGIEEGVENKEIAMKIAEKYIQKFGFQLFEWD